MAMQDDDMIPAMDKETGEMRIVPRSELKASPPRRTLTDDQSRRLKMIWDQIGEFGDVATFEQFETDFMRDDNPESEVRVWSKIAVHHSGFLKANPNADPKKVYQHLLILSMGMEESPPTKLFRMVRQFANEQDRAF